ncbi:MAG TPA: hypothetical protein VGH74_01600 [Planctomycetaceae bacterium]
MEAKFSPGIIQRPADEVIRAVGQAGKSGAQLALRRPLPTRWQVSEVLSLERLARENQAPAGSPGSPGR